jgi:hypothetical protein
VGKTGKAAHVKPMPIKKAPSFWRFFIQMKLQRDLHYQRELLELFLHQLQ